MRSAKCEMTDDFRFHENLLYKSEVFSNEKTINNFELRILHFELKKEGLKYAYSSKGRNINTCS